MLQLPLNVSLDDSARFDNYYFAGNEQLIKRLRSLDCSEGDFIYVWGAAETGKTHLSQALCHQLNERSASCVYLPLDFPSLTIDVLEGLAEVDIVCLDNFDAIIGKTEWEIGIFNLYNNLKANGKPLIITSQKSAADLDIKLKDLHSRITAMEVYRLNQLSHEEKVAFFIHRAANRGLTISQEVAQFILSRQDRSMSNLIEILEELDRSSMVLKRRVTLPLVKQILSDER